MSELTFEQMLDESFKTIHNGEVVDGTVIDVKPDEIILNIGYKSDGIIPLNEFFAEEIDQVNTQVVYLVVVITEAREFALNIETFCQTDVVAACGYFGIFDGRQ